mgnify:FL=1
MFLYAFSFRSLTGAQTGRDVLNVSGIAAELSRAPKSIAVQGCGYVLEVSEFDGVRAAGVLRSYGVGYRRVFRLYEDGAVQEADHDLF